MGCVRRVGAAMSEARWLVSVDPGTKAAWVLWERTASTWTPVRIGRAKAPSAPQTKRLLELLVPEPSQAHLVVEGQFYVPPRRGGYQSSPWNDVARLIELRCRWEDGAAELGISSEVAAPGTWIKAMTKGARGKTSKDRIAAMTAQWLPGIDLIGDEHDAALLGVWAIRRWGHGVVVKREEAADAHV